ncbi:fructose-6-phosphate aldolase [Desulfovibrio psychrotolerans]|uniref:Probable transaldolase n=1 Tax=Desulfovibrio psychrotolerans TaxID=415242 RepID=A0A7J0BP62_9BACT|nr:fructose-6-phosphate aldolase [Desulfovibrio psychrotolerans]GFM35483.1 transaldolase [Desulfovibrio psychrotolerans]
MLFFIDTANLPEIREAKAFGLIDGVTTNPTLFSKEISKEKGDWRDIAADVCREVDGPVSLEVVGLTAEEMIAEARDLVRFGSNVVVKIPMIPEGIKAVSALTALGIETNVTLVFSPLQALLAAKAGATYVSPFVGRLDGLAQDGMHLVQQILTIYANYGYATKVLVASVRHPRHVLDAAIMGAHAVTVPFAVLKSFAHHPLTDSGLEAFLKDWQKVIGTP